MNDYIAYINNRIFTIDSFDYITFDIYDSNGKLLVNEYTFHGIGLGVPQYGVKTIKFVFPNVPVRDITEAYGYHKYYYHYHF